MRHETVLARVEKLAAEKGDKVAHDYLLKHIADMKDALTLMEEMKTSVENHAVNIGKAIFVPGDPRELGPTKDMFISKYGVDDWLKLRRFSNPSPKFRWLP